MKGSARVSVSIASAIVGAALLVLGIAGGISSTWVTLPAGEWWQRGLLMILGCGLLATVLASLLVRRKTPKAMGTSMFFVDRARRILLVLRDDKKGLSFPNCWDVPGGHVEPGETPVQCICREMDEEMGLHLEDPSLFSVVDMPDRIECCFWQRADVDARRIRLTEGQRIEWFSESDVARIPDNKLAFGFRTIICDFFRSRPFDREGSG